MRRLDHIFPLLNATTTFCGYLVQIDGVGIARMSSWEDVTWQDEVWTGNSLVSISLSDKTPYAPGGTLEIADPDYAFLASTLRNGIVGERVRIWYTPTFDLSLVEPILIVDAFGDVTQSNPSKGTLTITIVPDDGAHLMAPRERVTLDDYPDPVAPGSVIKFGNGQITLMGSRI